MTSITTIKDLRTAFTRHGNQEGSTMTVQTSNSVPCFSLSNANFGGGGAVKRFTFTINNVKCQSILYEGRITVRLVKENESQNRLR